MSCLEIAPKFRELVSTKISRSYLIQYSTYNHFLNFKQDCTFSSATKLNSFEFWLGLPGGVSLAVPIIFNIFP